MNHAEKISRTNKNAEDKGPQYTVFQTGRVLKLDAKTKRSGRTIQRQKKICTTDNAPNAFLKQRFYTRLQEPMEVADCDKDKLQRDFYKSLRLTSKKLGIKIRNTRRIPYPYNISASLIEFKKQLKVKTFDWKEVRLIHDNGSTYFAQEKRYDTGMTLYYIPVIPLYTILQKKETEKVGLLLLSLYAYLYQVLSIPYYRDEGCYLNHLYEILEDWAINERAGKITFTQIKDAKVIGDRVKELICDPIQLKSFGKRLRSFRPKTSFDNSCLIICQRFYETYRKYGKRRIDHNINPLRYRDEIDETDRPVMLDDYVSFCASLKGDLFDTLCETASDEFQEYSEIDEPVRFVPYDQIDTDRGNFDFETAVFGGIDDLLRLWHQSEY